MIYSWLNPPHVSNNSLPFPSRSSSKCMFIVLSRLNPPHVSIHPQHHCYWPSHLIKSRKNNEMSSQITFLRLCYPWRFNKNCLLKSNGPCSFPFIQRWHAQTGSRTKIALRAATMLVRCLHGHPADKHLPFIVANGIHVFSRESIYWVGNPLRV
jgi:hypothetical protein